MNPLTTGGSARRARTSELALTLTLTLIPLTLTLTQVGSARRARTSEPQPSRRCPGEPPSSASPSSSTKSSAHTISARAAADCMRLAGRVHAIAGRVHARSPELALGPHSQTPAPGSGGPDTDGPQMGPTAERPSPGDRRDSHHLLGSLLEVSFVEHARSSHIPSRARPHPPSRQPSLASFRREEVREMRRAQCRP